MGGVSPELNRAPDPQILPFKSNIFLKQFAQQLSCGFEVLLYLTPIIVSSNLSINERSFNMNGII